MLDQVGDSVNSDVVTSLTPIDSIPSTSGLETLATKVIAYAQEHPKATKTAAAVVLGGSLLILATWLWRSIRSEEEPIYEPEGGLPSTTNSSSSSTPSVLAQIDPRPLNEIIHELALSCRALNRMDCELRVEEYVRNHIWDKLSISPACNNEKNKTALIKKLFNLLHPQQSFPEDNHSSEATQIIAINIVSNFSNFLSQSLETIELDIETNGRFRDLFDIPPHSPIQSLEMAGDETHNQGKVPLILTLEGGKRIVYKPRSLHAELALCGDLKSCRDLPRIAGERASLFSRLGLPTYTIYSTPNYGYAAFLENRGNTFTTREELLHYYLECGKIEQIAQMMGMSDLHEDNFITLLRHCNLIDCEVISLPTQNNCFVTGFFSGGNSPLKVASGGNRIELADSLITSLDTSLITDDVIRSRVQTVSGIREIVHNIGVYHILESFGVEFNEALQSIREGNNSRVVEFRDRATPLIPHYLAHLSNFSHRIILCETKHARTYIQDALDFNRSDLGWSNLSDEIATTLEEWGFEPDSEVIDASVRSQFAKDVYNNDVPVFYYNRGFVYYGNFQIGGPKTYSPSSSSSTSSSSSSSSSSTSGD